MNPRLRNRYTYRAKIYLDKPLSDEHDQILDDTFSYEDREASWPDGNMNWVYTDKGAFIWTTPNEFENALPWLIFLIEKYLQPWGYAARGTIEYDDLLGVNSGIVRVSNNTITRQRSVFSYGPAEVVYKG